MTLAPAPVGAAAGLVTRRQDRMRAGSAHFHFPDVCGRPQAVPIGHKDTAKRVARCLLSHLKGCTAGGTTATPTLKRAHLWRSARCASRRRRVQLVTAADVSGGRVARPSVPRHASAESTGAICARFGSQQSSG